MIPGQQTTVRLVVDAAMLRQCRLDLIAAACDHAAICIEKQRFDLALDSMAIAVQQIAILKVERG